MGTSSFNIQQDTTETFANADWTDEATNSGGELTFTAGSLTLTPGDTTFAPVALRADATSVAGTVPLQKAVPATGVTVNDTGNALWDAVDVKVYTQKAASTPFDRVGTCDAAGVATADWTAVTGVTKLGTPATATQVLAAASGDVQHYCFAVTLPLDAETTFNPGGSSLPAETLQGRSIAPAWEFAAVSN